VLIPSGDEKVLWMRNYLIECRAVAEETNGTLSVMEFTIPPKDGPPVHKHHDEDETYYVLEGTFLIQVGSGLYEVTSGGCVFGPREVTHGFVNAGSAPGRLLVIATRAGIEDYHEESGQPARARTLPPPAGAPDMELMTGLAEKYRFELMGPPLRPDAVV